MKKNTINLAFLLLLIFITQVAFAFASSPKILVFTKTKGFFHSSIPKGMTTIMDICKQNNIIVDTTREASLFTTEFLKQYKVVVFLNTTGDILNDTQQAAFEKYIQSGGGFVGIHAATDTEYDWPWYNKLVGAYFLSHPPNQQVAVIKVVDKSHPATRSLPDSWIRTDEWYNFKNINPDIKVLAYLDETSYRGGENVEKHPLYGAMSLMEGVLFIPE